MKPLSISRRKVISAGSLAGMGVIGAAMSPARGETLPHVSLSGPHIDVRTPRGALLAQARICGNLDPTKPRFDWFDGQMMGVAPNGNVTPLAAVRGFIRSEIHDEEGKWSRHRRLVCAYYDLHMGKRLEDLYNPFTGSVVKVGHIDGAVSRDELELHSAANWQACGENFEFHDSEQVSFLSDEPIQCLTGLSITSHNGAIADLQDPALTTISDQGTWTIITDWLPWLAMGGCTTGHCVFQCRRGGGPALTSDWHRVAT